MPDVQPVVYSNIVKSCRPEGCIQITGLCVSHLLRGDNFVYLFLQVGTGYSFTDNKAGYSSDETDVAENLYSSLIQFFTIFSDYQKNDFYLTGEVHMYA